MECKQNTKLEAWRCQQGLSYEELGKKLGKSASTAWRLCHGRTYATKQVSDVIRKVTGGVLDVATFDQMVDAPDGRGVAA